MKQIIGENPEILREIKNKVPIDVDPSYPQMDEFILIICEKLGKSQ